GGTSGKPFLPQPGSVVLPLPGGIDEASIDHVPVRAAPELKVRAYKDDAAAPEPAPIPSWVDSHHKELKEALVAQRDLLEARKRELEDWDDRAKDHVKTIFGKDDEATRQMLLGRIDRTLALNEELRNDPTFSHFKDPPPDAPLNDARAYAYVYPDDE